MHKPRLNIQPGLGSCAEDIGNKVSYCSTSVLKQDIPGIQFCNKAKCKHPEGFHREYPKLAA